MKKIPLSQGMFALVDDADYEELNKHRWSIKYDGFNYYAKRCVWKGNDQVSYNMHRVILGITNKNITIDHIDGNGLNNQRDNLRIATRQQNGWNRKITSGCMSVYKGVTWSIKGKRWIASIVIWINGEKKREHIGCYKIEEEAARAYDHRAKGLQGEFARLNFPEKEENQCSNL